MTARGIQDVNADVLAVLQAEDRLALTRFNEQLLEPVDRAYAGILLTDGNDQRGMDVGILRRPPFWIESMVNSAAPGRLSCFVRPGEPLRSATAELSGVKRHELPDAHRRPAGQPLHSVRQPVVPPRPMQ